jgi:hypothetical protein
MDRTGDDSDTEAPANAPEPEIDPATGRPIIVRSTTKTAENTARAFPLKLLVHSDASGALRLLQQAYMGEELGVSSVATAQTAFSDLKKVTGRTSSSHFPMGMKRTGTGTLGLTGSASFTVPMAHNDPTNPFVHAYHPDHDNLDARFEQLLDPGKESPAVSRSITLTFSTPAAFNPAWGASQLGGTYTETVTGLRAQPIVSSGSFLLQRMDSAEVFLNP